MGDVKPAAEVDTPIGRESIRNLGHEPTPKVEQGEWTVDKVIAQLPDKGSDLTEGSASPLPFLHLLERLKTTRREGWRRFGITNCESIADHMYRMSQLTLVAPPSLTSKLDMYRCMKMCLIHDMAESLVGDITPVDNVPKAEKARREAATMEYIAHRLLGNVHNGDPGRHISEIWQEYEDSKTPESVFVHDLDKLELLLQMVEYERRVAAKGDGELLDLGEFAYVKTKIRNPEIIKWADEVLAEREALWGQKKHIRGEFDFEDEEESVSPVIKKQQDDYYADA